MDHECRPSYYPTRWDLGETHTCHHCGTTWAVGWGYDRATRHRRPVWKPIGPLTFIPLIYRAVRKGPR